MAAGSGEAERPTAERAVQMRDIRSHRRVGAREGRAAGRRTQAVGRSEARSSDGSSRRAADSRRGVVAVGGAAERARGATAAGEGSRLAGVGADRGKSCSVVHTVQAAGRSRKLEGAGGIRLGQELRDLSRCDLLAGGTKMRTSGAHCHHSPQEPEAAPVEAARSCRPWPWEEMVAPVPDD